MPDTFLEIYLHIVWTTKYREPLLVEPFEEEAYKFIYRIVEDAGCECRAIGGMPDHVHLLIKFASTIALKDLMNQVKGKSSAFLNDRMFPDRERYFRWQPGYSSFSVSRTHVDSVQAYVLNQKTRHGRGNLWKSLEKVDGNSTAVSGVREEATRYEIGETAEDDPFWPGPERTGLR